jgi:hypothetical protein
MANIISIGDECEKLGPACRGHIHSVFDKVVNIETEAKHTIDNLFSVCVYGVPQAPARIITDNSLSWISQGLYPGKEINIVFGDAPVWRAVKDYKLEAPEEILRRISKISIPENDGLKGIEYNDVDALIGRGMGLTPSGDDFLAGVLYSLYFLRCGRLLEPLSKKLRNSLEKTTRLSCHFLKYALAGKWGQTEENVMLALMTDSGNNLSKAVNSMLAVGASSGADEMLGITAGIRAAIGS